MKTELTRFLVKPNKSAQVNEWMEFLRSNIPAIVELLDGEKIYVESIFRTQENGREFLYWYTIQEEGGMPVEQSDHEVDKKHLEYWKECIDMDDPDYKTDMQVEMFVVQKTVKF